MRTLFLLPGMMMLTLLGSCEVMVDGPTSHEADTSRTTPITPVTPHQPVRRNLGAYFPFDDKTNWWRYSEEGGNTVAINVTDTISDDGVMYYRVSFKENRVDTTDDWFQRSASGVLFGQSLTGTYDLFLPARIDSARGGFMSGFSAVSYTYSDSLPIDGIVFRHVLQLRYSAPILHGFDGITFADSIGIVRLTDDHGRWPIDYVIDSCSVFGVERRF